MGNFREGGVAFCKKCNTESFVKREILREGWTKVGETLVCALCGHPFPGANTSEKSSSEPDSADRLSSIFGLSDDKEEGLEDMFDATAAPSFCRDCKHYVEHPFVNRCVHHGKPVEPMHHCDDFTAREKDKDA